MPRTTLVEQFTSGTCSPCEQADPPFVRLVDEYHDRPMIHIAWHMNWPSPGTDPFYGSIPLSRRSFYGVDSIPNVIYDGGGAGSSSALWLIGAQSTRAETYTWYKGVLDQQIADTTTLSMTVRGDLGPSSLRVTTSITAVDAPPMNLRFKIIVVEDDLYCDGTMGCTTAIRVHRAVGRDLPVDVALPPLIMGQTLERVDTFAVNGAWDLNRLGIVAFVQSGTQYSWPDAYGTSNYNYEVVQAASARLVKPTVLVHRDDGLTDYSELYEEEMVQVPNSYQFWNSLVGGDTGSTDVRPVPTDAQMAEYGAVIWSTDSDNTGSLDATERAAIASYLDSYAGNMLITGENIGDEIYAANVNWFHTYLKSDHILNSWSSSTLDGVAGDPISNGYNDLTGAGTSPSRLTAYGSASPTFYYNGGVALAAVKAQHDSNSRVVFNANNFFKGSDVNRDNVMDKILKWLDGAAGPQASVTYPAGGETFAPGDTIEITWNAVDVFVPETGVDIYYAADSTSPSWTVLGGNEPNDGRFTWTAPNIASDKVRVRIVVRDGDPGTPNADLWNPGDFTIGSLATLDIDPADGVHRFMSVRVAPLNGAPSAVFATVLGNIGTVRAYDPTDPSDPWKSWSPSRGGDLTMITNEMGLWVEVLSAGTMNVFGAEPTGSSIPLKAGWNLVGFPSNSNTYSVANLKASTGATRVEAWDGAAAPYHLRALSNGVYLDDGQAYWVLVPADTMWSVPA